jgi:hypothetical protein
MVGSETVEEDADPEGDHGEEVKSLVVNQVIVRILFSSSHF